MKNTLSAASSPLKISGTVKGYLPTHIEITTTAAVRNKAAAIIIDVLFLFILSYRFKVGCKAVEFFIKFFDGSFKLIL